METEIEIIGRPERDADRDGSEVSSPAAMKRLLAEIPQQSVTAKSDLDAPYLTSMLRAELLSPALEAKLFRALNQCKLQAIRLQRRLTLSKPDAKVVRGIERWMELAAEFRNRLVAANVRLVVSVAKKFAGDRCSLGDLISDGNLTLLKAVDKFDVSRGFRFSTYATWALRYDFARSIGKKTSPVGRFQASDEQLDALADVHDDLEQERKLAIANQSLERMLAFLDPREHAIIERRFGLAPGGEERSLQEIAKEMGVCKERVRQLQLRALEKLRMLVGRFPLEPFDAP